MRFQGLLKHPFRLLHKRVAARSLFEDIFLSMFNVVPNLANSAREEFYGICDGGLVLGLPATFPVIRARRLPQKRSRAPGGPDSFEKWLSQIVCELLPVYHGFLAVCLQIANTPENVFRLREQVAEFQSVRWQISPHELIIAH